VKYSNRVSASYLFPHSRPERTLVQKKKNKYFFILKNPNLSEKLLLLNVLMTVFTVIFSTDMDGYAGRLPLFSWFFLWSRTTCMGFMSAVPSHLGVMLVTAWITIIDGGKNKRTPPWALWFGRFQYVGQYIAEVIGGNLEYIVGPGSNYSGGMSTEVTYYKYWFNTQHWVCYLYLCLAYGRKISRQLKGSGDKKGKESAELKKIRKYARTGSVLYSLSILTRIGGIGSLNCMWTNEKCLTRNQIAPCVNEPFWYLMILYWMVSYGICYAQQPGKKKYTTRAYEAVKSTFRSSMSKSRGSTRGSSKSGNSSKASSKKSSTGWSRFSGSGGSSNGSSTGSDSSDASDISDASTMDSSFASENESQMESQVDEVEEVSTGGNSAKVVPENS